MEMILVRSNDSNSSSNLSDEERRKNTRGRKNSASSKPTDKLTMARHESKIKKKKQVYQNLGEEKTKNNGLESTISEDKGLEEQIMNKEKATLILKSNEKDVVELNKENGDSHSGRGYQNSKFASLNLNTISKLVSQQVKEDHGVTTDSSSKSVIQSGEKKMISKEQSLSFKSHVVKILNKFEEVCSAYKSKMKNIERKHFKQELIHQECAANIIKESQSVINILKMELDAQEKELTNFYKEWHKNYSSENSDSEDGSLSENEVLGRIKNKEQQHKSQSSSEPVSIAPEFHKEEIFIDTGTNVLKADFKKVKNNEVLACTKTKSGKLIDDDSGNCSNRPASPILGINNKNRVLVKNKSIHNSVVCDPVFEPQEFQSSENNSVVNESVDDIFNESTIEFYDVINGSKQNNMNSDNENKAEKLFKNGGVNKKLSNKNLNIIHEKKTNCKSISPIEILDTIEKGGSNGVNDLESQRQAKKVELESDSEAMNEEFQVETFTDKVVGCNSEKKDKAQSKEHSESKSKIEIDKDFETDSSDEQYKLSDVKSRAKRALLESNSDNSMSSCDIKESLGKRNNSDDNNADALAKEELLLSSNSESSSSDNGIKNMKADSSSKKGKEESVIQKRANESKRVPHCPKINYAVSDKKLEIRSKVRLERLPDKVLKKYKNALDKSRQFLEQKEIKSLIDLDRLQRNCRSISDATQSPKFRKICRVAKGPEDTLLNHLKEVEEANFKETGEDSNSDNDTPREKAQFTIQSNVELMRQADAATKSLLLHSSDSDVQEQTGVSKCSDNKEGEDEMKPKKLNKRVEKTEKNNDDKENEEDRKKSKWRRNKLLTMMFSSDEDFDYTRMKWNSKQKALQEKEDENSSSSTTGNEIISRKIRRPRKIINSDSDMQLLSSDSHLTTSVEFGDEKSSDSGSSVGKKKKGRKRKPRKSSDTDSSFAERRTKLKKRRIKNISSDSDGDSDRKTNSQGTTGTKSRKNIRRVMKDKQVADDTKQAAKEEEERLKRIAERQKLYNEMYEARLAGEEKVDKLILDFNPETKEELVTVHENLVKRLKPHQAKGIKFMWDACFESLERIKTSPGSGCIIAHCMGLGKTLQLISLTHTLLSHEKTNVKTVLVVCPLSTVLNWLNEFKLWLKDVDNDIKVYEMTKMKQNIDRRYQLERWQRTGGVLIIGYEMFRNLTGTNNRMKKHMKEAILRCLIDPGPDVIACDEGHLLKNEDTALSKSIKRIKTLRRIVLTGTPLQNNLIEYHCMVQFVKPNLLGTRKEFLNRFANPITNGQFDNSTEYDVKLMKKRAYVLHKMLKGSVQRFDYSVLTPFLPPKQEYVIFVKLTEVQINMYRYYLEHFARKTRSTNGSLFADFQALQRIWTHPEVLRLNAEKIEKLNERKSSFSDTEGSLKDFIDDSESDSSSIVDDDDDDDDDGDNDDDGDVKSINSNSGFKNARSLGNSKLEVEVTPKPDELEKKEGVWWEQFVKPEYFEDMRVSSKLLLLFGILKECEQIGDKVLVFSQSLYSLTLIEQFLEKIDNHTQNNINSEYIEGHTGSWTLGLDYFRLDGQSSAENRNAWCRIFNRPTNTRARLFIISTRAGGLGINLTAANRVIIFDASWNPSHDVQSIFRVYRFGQKKPCYIYRFLAAGTMEEKIYNRQVTKLSLSCRVVDVQQIERHYSNNDLSELYKFEPNTNGEKKTLNLPKDRLLAELFLKYKDFVENYHEHDSLLENKAEEELNEEERKQAWLEYEEEKKGKPLPMPAYSAMAAYPHNVILNQYNVPSTFNMSTDYAQLQELLRKDYPNATPEVQEMMTTRVLTEMYSYWEKQAYHNANPVIDQNAAAKQVQMRNQVPNLGQTRSYSPYAMKTANKNLVNQPKAYKGTDTRLVEVDDDVVEIPSSTTNSQNKNQEE